MNCTKDYVIEITDSLMPSAWWPLNEVADPRVDSIGGVQLNSINAAVIGSAAGLVSRGSVHQAVSPIVPANLRCNLAVGLANTANGFDLMGWFKYVSIGTQSLLVTYFRPPATGVVLVQPIPSSNQVEVDVFGDTLSDFLFIPQVIVAGQWYFYRVCYDPVTQKFGVQIGDTTTLGALVESIAVPLAVTASGGIQLEEAFSPADSSMFDETGFFNRKLTLAEVNSIWNGGAGRTFP